MATAKPKFFTCFRVNPRTQEVTELDKHPGPSAQEVADALAATLPEGQLISAVQGEERAFSFGKVKAEETKEPEPHFIVFIGDRDVWITTKEGEDDLQWGLSNSDEYDRKEAFSAQLHITLRPVVTAEDLVWTPPEETSPEKK